MMKKLFTAIAMFLLALLAFAQDKSQQTLLTVSSGGKSLTISADTMHVVAMQEDTITSENVPESLLAGTDRQTQIITIDDCEYILADGHAYRLDEVLAPPTDWHMDSDESDSTSGNIVPILAICFIVPCVTLIIVLVLLFRFFINKEQARNAIIAQAISNNYTLPDLFYSHQSATENYGIPGTADGTNGDAVHNTAPRYVRDPKSFSSAISLLAVGISLMIFFIFSDKPGLGFLTGGVPMFLGIGKLIGYFYIPGYRDTPNQKKRQHLYGNGNNNHPNNPQQPHMPQNNTGAYPPPYNNGNYNRSGNIQ